jgi:L-alanine-DL-glutamate epimerase-like enolase superfamily enzyme
MRIQSVEPILMQIPFSYGPANKRQSNVMDVLYVRIDTDEGVTGWGEAFGFRICPATHATIAKILGPKCVGGDPADVAQFMSDLTFTFKSGGRSGPVMFGLSGIDIALWDIAGKVAGKPVHELLGGKKRDRVAAYASLQGFHDPDAAARNAADTLADGYTHVKLHERDIPCVAAARKAVGEKTPLMIDVNCVFTPDEALAFAHELEPYDLGWFEEPSWPPEDHAAMKRIRRETNVPVAAGENATSPTDLSVLALDGVVDVLQPDVIKSGGITAMRRIFADAASAGVAVSPHSPYFGPGLIASIHLAAVTERESMCERFYLDFEASPLGSCIDASAGSLAVPDGPGLGITVDEKIVAKYRVA